ncbi:MAG TPA: ATP-dependent sacrificial sulfur transferase LarE [Bryobacteraceae bacterium]|nr:ATP-dependent sacrificial sulfur transferase LarE [Bryobacteraceae bacterium]
MASLVTFQASSPNFDSTDLEAKQNALFECIRELERVIVAYSGGTDSAYLAWAANRALGNNAVAVTADSASMPESHKRDAEAFAREAGFHHEYIATNEFDNPDYVKNDKDRCFHCKDELFTQLEAYAEEHGYRHIIYGVNKDDLGDYRPGQRAAKMHDVKAPLVEAALTKAEIRELSHRAGLSVWDRPAAACLSSRVPYGTPVNVKTIKTIEEGEEAIKALGFRQFRVRFHGDLVRIEIARDELQSAMSSEMFARFAEIFKSLGFHFITLDVEGYRQGALNAALAE